MGLKYHAGFIAIVTLLSALLLPAHAVIRDGGIDPWNLGKGDWVYSMKDATNKVGGHVASVTNETSLMLFYKSQGIRYFIVKAATNDKLFGDCYPGPQFNSALVNIAHANGILIFGYNRSYGSNIVGEVAIANYVFTNGADGFVFDAEAEWESGQPWIGANGPALAWDLCSTVRSNWPNKFLAHAPFPIIYLHASFPYKEFGYWCDAAMPQIYHFSASGLKGSPSAAINWSDVNWKTWQNSVAALPPTNINGLTVYWTNAIKPLLPLRDVYGPVVPGGVICEGTASSVFPDRDVMEFIDYSVADPNTPTVGGYQGANFWRTDLQGAGQWAYIKAGTIGSFPGIVNNIVLDDAAASFTGAWTAVKVFGATTTAPTYYGATGTDTNSFGTNYFSKAQGIGTAYAQFTPNILVGGDYDVYQWHPYVTNASAGTPFVINHASGSTTVFANQQTNDGNWSLLGRFTFAPGTSGNIRVRDDFSDVGNVAIVDGLKLVFIATNTPAAPIISQPPTNLIAIAGSDATFSVAANGTAPLAYQWRFNTVPIPGATNSTYTRVAAQTNDAGNYSVTITNNLGSTNSAAALTVNYSLTTSVIGGGTVTPTPDPAGYTPGASVTLMAAPAAGFVFTSWSGDAGGSNNPLAVTLTTNKSVSATFLNTNTDIILDNTNSEVTFTASWTLASASSDKYLADYRYASTAAGGALTATYRPAIGNAGYYDVFIWYPQGGNRATNAPWSVVTGGGATTIAVDQTLNGGGWRLIATARPFFAGTNGYVRLSNDTGYSGKVVMADGVRFTFVGPFNSVPAISSQPVSRSVKAGTNVTFGVTATGVPAPAYQWRFNTTNLAGATASNYTRLNVQAGDAGDYSVIVSNSTGSVTSSNALLTVDPWSPVQFEAITRLPDGRMQLLISGESNANLWIDRTPALPPGWQSVTSLFNASGTVQFTDDAATNNGQGFYRARQ